MTRVNFWTNHFRTGTYDLYMPKNYDLSLRDGFTMLNPEPGSRILDAGCGNARILVHMRDWLSAGGRVTGFDVEQEGIKASQERAKKLGLDGNASFMVGNMLNMDDLDLQQFGAAIAHFSIYTLSSDNERRLALQNIAKHIIKDGRILVGMPNHKYNAEEIVMDAISKEGKGRFILSPIHLYRRFILYPKILRSLTAIQHELEADRFHKYSFEELEEHLRDAGFTDIDIQETYGGSGYNAVAKKV